MKRFAIILTTAVIAATTTTANEGTWSCNANGAALQQSDGKTLYLGKSCDAARSDGTQGYWWYSASALVYELEGEQLQRIEYDLPCTDLPYCTFPDELIPD